jgi:hypothetical protein
MAGPLQMRILRRGEVRATSLETERRVARWRDRRNATRGRPRGWSRKGVPFPPYVLDLRYGAVLELGYARVSTVKQDLDRQIDALEQAARPDLRR